MSPPRSIAYLNGSFLPLEEARVSILDRGFQFADGIYELLPAYGGIPFRLASHLDRLERSMGEIGLSTALTREDFAAAVAGIIERNGSGDCKVYIQVTRGVAERDHVFPDAAAPTVVMTWTPLDPVPAEWLEEGVGVITSEDFRWGRCDIKSIALLPNVMLRQRAAEQGALEGIWIHEGRVTEGAASNVFVVNDGEARTPPDGPRVLPGITRDLVLELAREQDLPVRKEAVSERHLHEAEEIWITSSTKELLPAARLDGQRVGSGQPGALFRETREAFRSRVRSLRESSREGTS